jgi:hypothetical protein
MSAACAIRKVERPAAGAVVFSGVCYDSDLRPCRIYAVSNGTGGMDWRVRREPFDPASGAAQEDRRFRSYADVIRWLAWQ